MKQIFVIGLSKFGYCLASELYEKGFEVVGIDKNEDRVQAIKDKVSQAIVANATDIRALKAIGIENAELAIICIGTSQSDSILTMYNLVELGIKKIIARALNETHGKILEKIGPVELIFPEKDLAVSWARKIKNPDMLEYIPFAEDYTIVEFSPRSEFIGKSLKEIDLINEFGVQIIAIKDVLTDQLNIVPRGNYLVKDSDVLIMLGQKQHIDKITKH